MNEQGVHGFWDPDKMKAERQQAESKQRARLLPPVTPPGPVKLIAQAAAQPAKPTPWTGASVQAQLAAGQALGLNPLVIRLRGK